jgi:16S rRNA (guanine966-N2)-methyltransferase
MRIIAGLYKGRVIKTVNDLSVRPATDRVKQTLFDILTNRITFNGARVLDLFAGSGNLGIEALSRGAQHVTFVEDNEVAAHYIEQNVRSLGCEEATEIHVTDALGFVSRCTTSYDLIFADPPYAFERMEEIPELLFKKHMLKPHGYLLVEHTKEHRFESTPLFLAGPEKRFGRTVVTFFARSMSIT